MHRDDTSRYLLFIEPSLDQKSQTGIDDIITDCLEQEVAKALVGTSGYSNGDDFGYFEASGHGYRGLHCFDGKSSSVDLLLPSGFITNEICVHYVRWYRDAIPDNDMKKLNQIVSGYVNSKKF